jgi:hypothetical protein
MSRRDAIASLARGDPSHVPFSGLVLHYVDAVVAGDEADGIGTAPGQLPFRFRQPQLMLGEYRLQGLLRGLVAARASATGPGQSDWAFNQWDGALGSVITINEDAFTAAVRDGHRTGSPWIALIPAMGTALIAALTVAGTHRRLAEYG